MYTYLDLVIQLRRAVQDGPAFPPGATMTSAEASRITRQWLKTAVQPLLQVVVAKAEREHHKNNDRKRRT